MFERNRDTRRRGAVAVLFAAGLVTLLCFGALAIDGGLICAAVGQMQRTADSSALAGASGLMNRTVEARAEQFAGLNSVINGNIGPGDLQITIGNWNGVTNQFIPLADDGWGRPRPNAVRVVGRRQNLGLFFAPVLGRYFTNLSRPATAVAGAGQCAGIWGLEGVTVSGNLITDSYDANLGNYGPGNVRPNGDVCSCRDFTINGGISIRGDAMYGEGYNFTPNGNSYEVVGMIDDYTCGAPDIEIDYAGAALTNDNASIPNTSSGRSPFLGHTDRLFLTNDEYLTLLPGTYYFGSATIVGQAYLEITGPTTIYIDGEAHLGGGGMMNSTEDPRNLIIYVRGPTVTYAGNAAFYGALVAPTAEVRTLGTFDAYGVVLARILTFGGDANFHVDEGLVFDLFGIRAIAPMLVE